MIKKTRVLEVLCVLQAHQTNECLPVTTTPSYTTLQHQLHCGSTNLSQSISHLRAPQGTLLTFAVQVILQPFIRHTELLHVYLADCNHHSSWELDVRTLLHQNQQQSFIFTTSIFDFILPYSWSRPFLSSYGNCYWCLGECKEWLWEIEIGGRWLRNILSVADFGKG